MKLTLFIFITLCSILFSLITIPAWSALNYNAHCTGGNSTYCDGNATLSWKASGAPGEFIAPYDYRPPYKLMTVICPLPNDLTLAECYQIPLGTVDISIRNISWVALQSLITGSVATTSLPRTRVGPTSGFCVLAYLYGADGKGVPMDRHNSFVPLAELKQYCNINTTGPGTGVGPTTPTNTCNVITKNMEVSFSAVDRSTIPTGNSNSVTLPLQLNCTGNASHSVNLRVVSTAPSWSMNAIATSFPEIAVTPIVEGNPIGTTNGTTYTIAGSSTINVSFSLSRDPSLTPSDIPTGAFSGSGIMTVTID